MKQNQKKDKFFSYFDKMVNPHFESLQSRPQKFEGLDYLKNHSYDIIKPARSDKPIRDLISKK